MTASSPLSEAEKVSRKVNTWVFELFLDELYIEGVDYEVEEPDRPDDPIVLIRHQGCSRRCLGLPVPALKPCLDGRRFEIDVWASATELGRKPTPG